MILQHKMKVNFVETSKSLNKVTKTKFMKSCSKLKKLPFHKIVAHETKSCQKVAEQLVETPRGGGGGGANLGPGCILHSNCLATAE